MAESTAGSVSAHELMSAVQRGNRAAFKRLYELESRRLFGIALRIVRRRELAADVVQDTFVQVWRNAASYSSERGDPAAWLTAIARYRALDVVRKLGREVLCGDTPEPDEAEVPDIVERLDMSLAKGALRRCLGELDENQRRCIALAFVEGFTHAEIAAHLPAPLGSVKSWVRRGLLALRSCLEP
jgi:RNA polymerase sigma-70 factor (ECF subfamily)